MPVSSSAPHETMARALERSWQDKPDHAGLSPGLPRTPVCGCCHQGDPHAEGHRCGYFQVISLAAEAVTPPVRRPRQVGTTRSRGPPCSAWRPRSRCPSRWRPVSQPPSTPAASPAPGMAAEMSPNWPQETGNLEHCPLQGTGIRPQAMHACIACKRTCHARILPWWGVR